MKNIRNAPVDTGISTRASERVLTSNQDLSAFNSNTKSRFMGAKDIAQECGVSLSKGYSLAKQLNKELNNMGKITIAGKVPRAYFEFKMYGGTE